MTPASAATSSHDTVDYTAVVGRIREINGGKRFNLIEALAAAIADDLIERFPVSRVRVRVRKPEVQLGSRSNTRPRPSSARR